MVITASPSGRITNISFPCAVGLDRTKHAQCTTSVAATRKQDLNSKRTSCGLALAARLGAVRRQSGCEYLLVADLDDVLAGQVPDARLALVLTQ